MRALVAILAGWILVEGMPQPAAASFDAWFPQGAWLWWLFGAGCAIAGCMGGPGGWVRTAWVALGAWLPTLVMTTPFAQLGPWWGGAIGIGLGGFCVLRDREKWDSTQGEAADTHWLWWGLLGAGAGLGLLVLGRILWLVGDSQMSDAGVALPTFLTLLAFGAFALGRLVPIAKLGRAHVWLAFGFGLAGTFALRASETAVTSRGLRTIVRRYGSDVSEVGTIQYTVLLTVVLAIIPAFLWGIALYCTQNRRQRLALFVGIGCALMFAPQLLNSHWPTMHSNGPTHGVFAMGFAVLCVAGLGMAVSRRAWFSAVATTALLLGAGYGYPYKTLEAAKPWERTYKPILWSAEIPQGQIAVYPAGPHALGARLNQRQITPNQAEMRLDERCLALSMQLLGNQRQNGATVLFSGLLTPERHETLKRLGAGKIDRVATYHIAGPRIESALGGAHPIPTDVGEWLSPSEAYEAVRVRKYDLILVPFEGRAFHNLPEAYGSLPHSTIQVVWQRAEDFVLAQQSVPGTTWVCSDGLDRFAIGSVQGTVAETYTLGWKLEAESGQGVGWRLPWLRQLEWERRSHATAAALEQMALGAKLPAQAEVFRTLVEHNGMQSHSSPFESAARQVELDPKTASRLATALKELGNTDPFTEEIAGGLARVMIGKRDIASVMTLLPGLSESMGRPFELERSLARAELESLDPLGAAKRLEALDGRFPGSESLWREWAIALDQIDRPAKAAEVWQRILAVHRGDLQAEKGWALALIRAGDPKGTAALQSLRARHPEDEDLKNVSQSGPPLLPKPEYTPQEHRHSEDHEPH